MTNSSKRYLGCTFKGVVEELRNAGFANVELECQYKAKKGRLSKEAAISKISVSGLQISPERCEPFASGGVNVSVSAVYPFRMNGAFRVCV